MPTLNQIVARALAKAGGAEVALTHLMQTLGTPAIDSQRRA
jgi:hypothetical protein